MGLQCSGVAGWWSMPEHVVRSDLAPYVSSPHHRRRALADDREHEVILWTNPSQRDGGYPPTHGPPPDRVVTVNVRMNHPRLPPDDVWWTPPVHDPRSRPDVLPAPLRWSDFPRLRLLDVSLNHHPSLLRTAQWSSVWRALAEAPALTDFRLWMPVRPDWMRPPPSSADGSTTAVFTDDLALGDLATALDAALRRGRLKRLVFDTPPVAALHDPFGIDRGLEELVRVVWTHHRHRRGPEVPPLAHLECPLLLWAVVCPSDLLLSDDRIGVRATCLDLGPLSRPPGAALPSEDRIQRVLGGLLDQPEVRHVRLTVASSGLPPTLAMVPPDCANLAGQPGRVYRFDVHWYADDAHDGGGAAAGGALRRLVDGADGGLLVRVHDRVWEPTRYAAMAPTAAHMGALLGTLLAATSDAFVDPFDEDLLRPPPPAPTSLLIPSPPVRLVIPVTASRQRLRAVVVADTATIPLADVFAFVAQCLRDAWFRLGPHFHVLVELPPYAAMPASMRFRWPDPRAAAADRAAASAAAAIVFDGQPAAAVRAFAAWLDHDRLWFRRRDDPATATVAERVVLRYDCDAPLPRRNPHLGATGYTWRPPLPLRMAVDASTSTSTATTTWGLSRSLAWSRWIVPAYARFCEDVGVRRVDRHTAAAFADMLAGMAAALRAPDDDDDGPNDDTRLPWRTYGALDRLEPTAVARVWWASRPAGVL